MKNYMIRIDVFTSKIFSNKRSPWIMAHQRQSRHTQSESRHGNARIGNDSASGREDWFDIKKPSRADRNVQGHRPHEHIGGAGAAYNTIKLFRLF